MKTVDPGDRAARLEHGRALKMARSAHAYVRGNTARFYEWLAEGTATLGVPEGPPIWICGDCHLGNLGPIADGDGRVDIEIRDLDQTVIGNPAHDMIRLALSLASAARGSDLPGVVTTHMIEAMRRGYLRALGDAGRDEAGPEPDVVKVVKRRALGRKWRHLAKERLEDVEPTIPLGKRFWPLSQEERAALGAVMDDENVTGMVLSLADKKGERVELVDAAYWMKGCSSLGLMRIAAIAAISNGGKSHALIDLKEASAPVAPAAKGARMPSDPSQRVVAGAKALSPNLGGRIAATTLLGRPMFVRELMPQDLKLEVRQFSRKQAVSAADYLAFIVGRAHSRQLSRDDRRAWAHCWIGTTTDTDASVWFWQSVVDLAARHEGAYLEHCRNFAKASNAV